MEVVEHVARLLRTDVYMQDLVVVHEVEQRLGDGLAGQPGIAMLRVTGAPLCAIGPHQSSADERRNESRRTGKPRHAASPGPVGALTSDVGA